MRVGNDHIGLINLVNSLNMNDLVVLEVGVFNGDGTESILSTNKVKKIYCVDLWRDYQDTNGEQFINMSDRELLFDNKFSNDNRVIKVKGNIDEFIKQYPDTNIDLAYIDASHTYDSCKHDILQCLNKIKPKLAISGHDYSVDYPHILGVRKSVNEIFNHPDYIFEDTSWIHYMDRSRFSNKSLEFNHELSQILSQNRIICSDHGINVGQDVSIGENVVILSNNHFNESINSNMNLSTELNNSVNSEKFDSIKSTINIGNNVSIGNNVVILSGCYFYQGCQINRSNKQVKQKSGKSDK